MLIKRYSRSSSTASLLYSSDDFDGKYSSGNLYDQLGMLQMLTALIGKHMLRKIVLTAQMELNPNEQREMAVKVKPQAI